MFPCWCFARRRNGACVKAPFLFMIVEFTERENLVLEAVAAGQTAAQIAEANEATERSILIVLAEGRRKVEFANRMRREGRVVTEVVGR